MRILKVCVGTPVKRSASLSDGHYLMARSFNAQGESWYLKKEVINQLSQANSLKALGLEIDFGFLSARRSLKNLLQFGLKLRRMVREEGVELVHVDWGSTTAMTAVLFSPVPVIISFCGSDLMGTVNDQGRKTLFGVISSELSQVAALGARRIIVKSEKLKNILWPMNHKKCVVIPNGVDLSAFYLLNKEQARVKLGWPDKGRIIIFFPSGGAPVKDQPLAEEVFFIVKNKMPDVQLKFVDNVPHEDLVYYYNAADLMLLTSRHEGSNNSLKEAMSCNLPVVSVSCGDAKERLAGVSYSRVEESRNSRVLAERVLEVLGACHRSDARTRIESLSIEKVARRIKGVYQEALS